MPKSALLQLLPSRWITKGVRRRVASFQALLGEPMFCGPDKKVRIECQRAIRFCGCLNKPGANPVRIKLLIPGCIEGVGKIDAFTISADFDHLRSPVECDTRLLWMRRSANDSADLKDRGKFRTIRDGDIVPAEFPGPPAGDIEPFVIQRKIDVCDQRRNGFEPFQKG